MLVSSTRFGTIAVEADDLLFFPDGLMGFEPCRHWVLLTDNANARLGWLQSVDRPDIAMLVVSPRRFVPDYKVRVSQRQLEPLGFSPAHRAYVLGIVGQQGTNLTLNLKAPLLVNLDRRLGCQVVTTDNQPLQFVLPGRDMLLRRSA